MNEQAPSKWEFFPDAAYFDMWCVRNAGERRFGYGFHVTSREEASDLVDLLSTRDDMLAALRHIGHELSNATLQERRLTKDESFALISWAVSAVSKATGGAPASTHESVS